MSSKIVVWCSDVIGMSMTVIKDVIKGDLKEESGFRCLLSDLSFGGIVG